MMSECKTCNPNACPWVKGLRDDRDDWRQRMENAVAERDRYREDLELVGKERDEGIELRISMRAEIERYRAALELIDGQWLSRWEISRIAAEVLGDE